MATVPDADPLDLDLLGARGDRGALLGLELGMGHQRADAGEVTRVDEPAVGREQECVRRCVRDFLVGVESLGCGF